MMSEAKQRSRDVRHISQRACIEKKSERERESEGASLYQRACAGSLGGGVTKKGSTSAGGEKVVRTFKQRQVDVCVIGL